MSDLQLILRRCKRGSEIKLDLSNRQIAILPSDLYGLVQLEILDLSNNKLSSLDVKISSLSSLKVLNLSFNSIQSLPSVLLQLKQLRLLNLSSNPLNKQFQPLLDEDNTTGISLSRTLKAVFSNASTSDVTDSSPLNKWFQEAPVFSSPSHIPSDSFSKPAFNPLSEPRGFSSMGLQQQQQHQQQNNANIMGQLVEKDSQIAQYNKKIADLTHEIQRLQMKVDHRHASNGSSGNKIIQVTPQFDPIPELNYKELEIKDAISQGGFSIVHQGRYKGCAVAIKKIFNPNITQDLIDEINNEVNMLAQLRHPNIILLMGIVSQPQNTCIVTDLVEGGDLFTYMHKQRKELSGQQKSFIVRQIIVALNYLHSNEVVHRDIKSYNILLDVGFKVKICDFGLARKFSELNQGGSKFSGTPTYMAPELFQKRAYDEKVDVYAFGSLLWEIYSGEVPFDGLEPQDIAQRVVNDDQLPQRNNIPSSVYQLILKCRHIKPSMRPSFSSIHSEYTRM